MSKHLTILILAAVGLVALTMGIARADGTEFFQNRADISRAQRILVAEGYLNDGSFTAGVLDEATRRALASYQSDHALNNRGTLDAHTFQTLLSHETSYPWGGGEQVAAAAEPVKAVAPVREEPPAPAPDVVQAPPIPEPAPATAEVKQAQVPEPAKTARRMPATAGHLPAMALAGLLLLGAGAALIGVRGT